MKRGEIWLINLDPTIGAEIRKTRPAVIVNRDGLGVLPLRVIVPNNRLERKIQQSLLDGEIGSRSTKWTFKSIDG